MEACAKKISLFWPLYCVFVLLSLISMTFGFSYLWDLLEDYERSTQEYALRCYLAPSVPSGLPALFGEGILTPGGFEDASDMERFASGVLAGGELSGKRVSGASPDGASVFVFSAGSRDVAAVALRRVSGGRFGRWEGVSLDSRLAVFGDLRVTAPADASVFVNGRVLSESAAVKTVSYDVLAGLPQGAGVPVQSEYLVRRLYNEPAVKAYDASGYEMQSEWKGRGAAEFAPGCPESEKEAVRRMVASDAELYSRYTSHDDGFAKLAARLLRGAPIYNHMRTMDTSYYTDHTGVKFKDAVVGNIRKFDPAHLAADIDFTYQVFRKGNRVHDFPTKATFVYRKKDGAWLVADIRIR